LSPKKVDSEYQGLVMVIKCSKCKTRFKVTDESIKPQGSKFRCSKCGAVLFIKKPIMQKKEGKKTKNDIDKFLESEKKKFEEQRLRQQRIVRVVSACLLPLFIGIGMTSFLALSKSLPTQVFFAVTILILVYSSASGVFEYIRIKKTGQKRSVLFTLIQSLLFVLVYIILLNLLN
jgi:predicted Zn finger-like uncharacterized protein